MVQHPSSFFPQTPVPEGAEAFSRQVRTLLDGRPKDDATVNRAFAGMDAMFDRIAAGLYSLASMLVGEGEESVRVVETAVATAEFSSNLQESRRNSRLALARAALRALEGRDPGSLAAPASTSSGSTCVEDDELEAAGLSTDELEHLLAGPDRDRVRAWLAQLPMPVRTVFALRAVAGFTAAETAALLAANSGPSAIPWTLDAVRDLFRQGLCSLASQLLHASAAH